jgi:hypothetical protein
MRLNAFCASHVEDADRVDLLIRAVLSIARSVDRTVVSVSISAPADLRQTYVDAILTAIQSDSVTFLFLNEQISQFQHYGRIVRYCLESPDCTDPNLEWVIFFDDDDYNHASRGRAFHNLIHSASSLNVRSPRHTFVVYTGVRDVVLDDGNSRQTMSDDSAVRPFCGNDSSESFISEHTSYAVPLAVMQAFDNILDASERNNVMCDLLFLHFVTRTCRIYAGRTRSVSHERSPGDSGNWRVVAPRSEQDLQEDGGWLYLRNVDPDIRHASIAISEEDLIICRSF